jgi:PAS domain S-box-containing protein
MKKNNVKFSTAADLRRNAEERLKAQKRTPQSDTDTQKLIHELQVHQIELDMQNEELSLSRANMESALERYTDLYDFAPVSFFTLDRHGIIIQSNLTGACLLGMERSRLVNLRFGLFVSVTDRPDFNAFLDRVFASKTEEVCDVALLKDEADPFWVHIEAEASGDRKDCRAVVMDITERKRAEESLRKNEKKMQSIFRAAPTGIGMVVNRAFTEVNQRFCDITGYTHDELIGQSTRMIYPSDADYEYVGREKYDQIAQKGTGAVEARFQRKDGAVIDVLLSSTPIDASDLFRGVTFTALDITERKRAEKALQQRAEELSALNALGRAVNATLSMEEATAAALQGMLNAVHPDLAFFFLREGDKLTLKKVLPPPGRQRLEGIPEHRVGECLCGLAAREKKPLYSRSIFDDRRCTWEECKKAGLKSFAALPLISGDEVIGVIGLASDVERDYERQAGFLETMAGQVSIALANARLFEIVQLELAERKRVEEALRRSREHFRALVEQSSEMIFVVDKNGINTYVSPSVERVLGYKPEYLTGKTAFHIIVPEEVPRAVHDFGAAILTKDAVIPNSFRVRHQDGSEHILEGVGKNLMDNPAIAGFVMNVSDVTESKKAEVELRRMQALLNEAQAIAKLGGWEFDVASKRAMWTDEVYRIYGVGADYDPNDIGKDMNYYSSESASIFQRAFQRAVELGEPYDLELEFIRANGERIWVRTTAKPILENGKVVRLTGNLMDITERKRAEEKLHHVLTSARCILWHAVVTDRVDGGIHWDLRIANEEAAEKMIPLPRKPGQRYSDVWREGTPREDVERMDHTSMRAMREGKTGYSQEFRLRLPSGEIRWLFEDARIQPIEPRRWSVVGVCTDITERKKAEEAIREQMDELRRWHEVTLGRETRVLDLKREVNDLLAKLGRPPRYESAVTDGGEE